MPSVIYAHSCTGRYVLAQVEVVDGKSVTVHDVQDLFTRNTKQCQIGFYQIFPQDDSLHVCCESLNICGPFNFAI